MLTQFLGFAVGNQMRTTNSELDRLQFEEAPSHDFPSRRASSHVGWVMVLPPWRDALQLIAAPAGASAWTALSAANQATD